jgi:leader peptidase (prepilin peptidase) / N-methyltransferase
MNPEYWPELYPPYALIALAVFVFGACIGSFLNVCIYRIPLDIALSRPRRSFCPHCRETIAWFDNLPVLSYFLLRGRCRHCAAPIRFRYALVEILTGALFVAVWMQYFPPGSQTLWGMHRLASPSLIPVYWLVVGGLIVGTFVDFEHLILPDRVTLGGMVAGLLLSLALPVLHGAERPLQGLLWSAVGAAAGWGLLWAIAAFGRVLFRKEAMGFGDVKLMGAIGAFFGWPSVVATIMISSLAGSVAGLAISARRGKLQSRIPYGPYLALATLLWMFWGPQLWRVYINLFAAAPAAISIP